MTTDRMPQGDGSSKGGRAVDAPVAGAGGSPAPPDQAARSSGDRAEDRPQATATLLAADQWAQVFSKVTFGIAITRPADRTFLMVNPAFAQMHGYAADELVGRAVTDLVAPELHDQLGRETPAGHEDLHAAYDSVHLRRDGSRFPVHIDVTAVRAADGKLLYLVAYVEDISARKRAEAALETSHDQLQAIFESVADGVMVQNATGTIVYANDAAAQLCGFPSREALLAAPIQEVLQSFVLLDESGQAFPPERLPARQVLQYGSASEAIIHSRAQDGSGDRWAITRARPVFDAEGNVVFAVSAFQDITAVKRGEEALRFLLEASRVLASSLDYTTTLAQVTRLAVPAFADRCVVDLIGEDGQLQRVAGFQGDPAKNALLQELLRRYPLDPNGTHPAAQAMRTGETILSVETPATLLVSIAQDTAHLELLRGLEGHSYISVPLKARGQILGVLSFYRAESPQKYGPADVASAEELAGRAALAVDNARLFRDAQEATHVREEFLSSVAHDLRTPLTIVSGLAQLLQRRLRRSSDPASATYVEQIGNLLRAANKMHSMIEELLDLGHLDAGRTIELSTEEMDLVALAGQLVAEYQQAAPHHRIVLQTTAATLVARWDATRLERALGNLLSNAVKYSPDGGEISVSLGVVPATNGGELCAEVQVRDSGMGIPAADLPQIFERFHRGDNVVGRIGGLGIGLSGTKQVVEHHGGTIAVESEEGKGSTFIVRLPMQDQLPGQ